jgi:hypothetical protein
MFSVTDLGSYIMSSCTISGFRRKGPFCVDVLHPDRLSDGRFVAVIEGTAGSQFYESQDFADLNQRLFILRTCESLAQGPRKIRLHQSLCSHECCGAKMYYTLIN